LAELDEAVDPALTPFVPPSAIASNNNGSLSGPNSRRETKEKEK